MTLLFAIWMAATASCPPAPTVEVPALQSSDRFAILLTGDGGWRPVDRKIADALSRGGVPVVGFLVPEYYGTRRTPEESACTLAELIRRYQQLWQKKKVIVIGFSRGADVLPFMINRLPQDARESIQLVALLGLEPMIDFEYHPFWSLRHYFRHPPQFEVLPEAVKLGGGNVLCVYGERESDTLCRRLDPAQFKIVKMPGGHHFAGRYDEVGKAILDAAR